MGRPRKQTVDYFPHDADASDKKTLYILESKFGNDGYAFWFKLLELLAKSEGHFYDVRNPAAWEFLLAKTHVKEDIGQRILNTLAELDAIDKELWGQKIIWSQNLVDNVADAYRNRKAEIPTKPSFLQEKSPKGRVSDVRNPQGDGITEVRNPHTKLKETKLKDTKGEGEGGMGGDSSPSSVLKIFLNKFPYAFGREPDSREMAQLRDFSLEVEQAGGATAKQIHDAFKEATVHNKCNVSYVRAVLLAWLGVKK